jgi:hypothetical protein
LDREIGGQRVDRAARRSCTPGIFPSLYYHRIYLPYIRCWRPELEIGAPAVVSAKDSGAAKHRLDVVRESSRIGSRYNTVRPLWVRALLARPEAFMAEEIYPNEEALFARVDEGDRWQPVPLLDELKAKARAKTCGTCFCHRRGS